MKYIEIIQFDGSKVVERLDVTDESTRNRESIEVGMNINLNHDYFYTRSIESEVELPTGDLN